MKKKDTKKHELNTGEAALLAEFQALGSTSPLVVNMLFDLVQISSEQADHIEALSEALEEVIGSQEQFLYATNNMRNRLATIEGYLPVKDVGCVRLLHSCAELFDPEETDLN